MKKYFVISLVFMLVACGTVFDGTGQMISFESNVKAVQVYIDGVKVCTTPCSYDVDRSMSDLEIEARKKGYQTQRMKLRANFNRISIFNLIGIQAHETMLGTYIVKGKEKIVCACKDFTADGRQLFDFCSIKNTVIDSEHGGTGRN